MTTPTDSAEKVVAELRARIGSEFDGELHLSEDEAVALFALIESQRAELEREQTESARRLACMDRRADRLIELTDALAKAKAEYDGLLSTWAESRDRHLAAEARVTALEAEKAGLVKAVRVSHVAMTLASHLPGMSDEYDFSEAIASTTQALSRSSTEVKNDG